MRSRNLIGNFLILIVLFGAVSCVETTVKGYTDLDFQRYKINKIMVRTPNASYNFGELLEQSMIDELAKSGVPASSFIATFPPTREWTNKQICRKLIKYGFDTIMHINLTNVDSSIQTLGYTTTGTANVYGNTTYYSSRTTASKRPVRYTSTRVDIYEVRTAKVIWTADADTTAGRRLFQGDKQTTKDMASEILKALKQNGHI